MKIKQQIPGWLTAAILPAALFYYEWIFRISTSRFFPLDGTVYMLLFSIAYAGIGYLIAALPKRKSVAYGLTMVWIFLLSIPFLIEYFVYLQFNVFYDISTCLNGADDVMTAYTTELFRLIFSRTGLWHIFLFLLPLVLFSIFGWCYATPKKLSAGGWVGYAGALILIYLLACFGISKTEQLSLICGKEYNYQTVVSNLGLMTGLRLDIAKSFSSDSTESFDEVVVIPVATNSAEQLSDSLDSTVPAETEAVAYTPNIMDIDFEKVPSAGNIGPLTEYILSQTPSMKNEYTGLFKGKNLIFITAEAFTAEVIDPELTPTLYRLATKGIQFTDYYQPTSCGTTGGEYQNIFGMLPGKGGGSFRASRDNLNYFTMGSQLDRLGYYGVAYHNHTHTYYDRDQTHNNLGYSEGFIAEGTGLEPYLSKLWPKSDVEMFKATVPTFIDKQPFNIYYMTYSGHCGYTPKENAFTKMHWDRVNHLSRSDIVKGYLAAQLELEDAMTYLVHALKEAGIADDTVICLSSDHFPYGLDSDSLAKLYGYRVNNAIKRDHSRLILWSGCLEKMDPIVVDTPTFSLDILPTLSNLFGTEFDSRLMAGRDVFADTMPLVYNVGYDWKTEYGTFIASDGKFYPADESIEIPEGYVDSIKAIVRNKIRFCKWILDTDYYRHLFGAAEQ